MARILLGIRSAMEQHIEECDRVNASQVRIGHLLPTGQGDPAYHLGAKRRSRRFPLHADVEMLDPLPAQGVAINMSAGGMRIALDQHIAVGELCTFEVRCTTSRTFVERGRVVWAVELLDGWVVGIEFVGVN